MSGPEQELASLRRARDDTRNALAEETLAVARGSSWVIAATLAVLGAWIFRGPLGDAVRRIREAVLLGEPPQWWTRFRSWALRKAKL